MPFIVHESNRAEKLVDALARVVSVPPADPLAAEVILVQSKGMERWIVRELSLRLDPPVFANGRFPFPNLLIEEVSKALLGDVPGRALFSREVMPFRILSLLPALLPTEPFAVLRRYLGDEAHGLKGFQLASRVADTFDQYALYRPELLAGFLAGADPAGDDAWQAVLWRALAAGHEGGHRGAVLEALVERFRRGKVPPGTLPERLSVVGIPALPPHHLRALLAFAAATEVHLFLPNPCGEFWDDTLSKKEMARAEGRARRRSEDASGQHYETGHPLLGSMGKLGRDFLKILRDRPEVEWDGGELFDPPDGGSLLSSLQSDIFRLVERGESPGSERAARREGPLPVREGDRSIRIHSVHSPMREMEVLHDQLLDLFETIPGLEPKDVAVMTPDIEAYAPYVSAVFGASSSGRVHIPHRVADRTARTENPAARALLALFRLHRSRFGAAEVLELLESATLCRRFSIAPEERGTIARWIGDVAIRWGIDGEDRRRMGLPPFERNGWREGIDRLLAGYAMKGDGLTLSGSLLPHEGVEGSDASLLGRFVAFAETLFSRVRDLERPRSLADWGRDLRLLLDDFVTEGGSEAGGEWEEGEGVGRVREHLSRLATLSVEASFAAPLSFEAVRHFLERRFAEERPPFGFLSGGVTFCEMLPMRGIPFRVVALVGMDSGAFPRQDRPPGFDLLAKHPRPGDRSFREEDRYLFLEALLSARDCFYVSYRGQSIVDNGAVPPSVLVSELLDCLDQGYFLPAAEEGGKGKVPAGEALVVRHRLQAFHPAYFDPSGRGPLFSYSEEDRRALSARKAALRPEVPQAEDGGGDAAEEGLSVVPFLSAPLPEPEEEMRHVTLCDLARFLARPAEHFLSKRLGIRIVREEEAGDDAEPFGLDPLSKYSLEQDLSRERLAGIGEGVLRPPVEASGRLPLGVAGDRAWDAVRDEVERFVASVAPDLEGGELPAVSVDLRLTGKDGRPFRLTGKVRGVYRSALVRYRCAAVKGKDLLSAWVDHLALAAVRENGKDEPPGGSSLPSRTVLHGMEQSVRFAPPVDPGALLASLLDIYWRGLSEPLPFFPESSFAYVEELRKGGEGKSGDDTHRKALDKARLAWEGSRFSPAPAERDNEWHDLAFGIGADPIGSAGFPPLAAALFTPLLESLEGGGKA